jgi:non-ribosomal peptide synthetase component F
LELNRRANQIAHTLRKRGIEKGDWVAISLDRSLDMIVAIIGIIKTGAAYVPLDAFLPRERLAFMINDTRPKALLMHEKSNEVFSQFSSAELVPTIFLDRDRDAIAAEPVEFESEPVRGEDLFYLVYTSGSTGTPKGVCGTHRGVVRLVMNTNYIEIAPSDVFFQFAPVSFDASTFEIFGPLLNGARLEIFPAGKASHIEVARFIRDRGATVAWLTSGFFHQMVDECMEEFAGLRVIIVGGDVLSVHRAQKVLGKLKAEFLNAYGPTENTTFTSCYRRRRGGSLSPAPFQSVGPSRIRVFIFWTQL